MLGGHMRTRLGRTGVNTSLPSLEVACSLFPRGKELAGRGRRREEMVVECHVHLELSDVV